MVRHMGEWIMKKKQGLVAIVAILASVVAAEEIFAAGAVGAYPIERYLNIRSADSPALSPDGNQVAFLTGITGAMIAKPVLNLLGIRDWPARGFAVGLTAHGIGTARAFQVNEVAGTFAGIAMGLNGLATAFLVPLLASLLT